MNFYPNPVYRGADPFILLHEGVYYLYATNAEGGYKVASSENLITWVDHGYCLRSSDVHGGDPYFAPEILVKDGKFYMVYTAERHLGIAVSDSPLGPFKQEDKRFLSDEKAIDGHFFLDDDGSVYLYYVRKRGRNDIWVAKMSDDLLSIDEKNERLLIVADEPWETDMAITAEGPFVLKHNGIYYLTYSGCDYRSPNYAIGYATSDSPIGPFKKYSGNPILKGKGKIQGTGHHSFTTSKDGKTLIIAYHCHNSEGVPDPRLVCVNEAEFIPCEDGEDILVVHGPTSK